MIKTVRQSGSMSSRMTRATFNDTGELREKLPVLKLTGESSVSS